MPETDHLIHEILPVGMLQCNCHIVGDPETREAIVIDPGDDAERILAVIARYKLRVKEIVITHAHIDHVVALRRLQEATGAPVAMHAEDLELYNALEVQAAWIGWKTPEKAKVDQFLREGDTIRWGHSSAEVLHTPGHTRGSICLYMPSEVPAEAAGAEGKIAVPPAPRLFAGDTLFAGSIGRTDLWGGSMEAILKSLKGKLIMLPDQTIVYPGHGEPTTIGEERENNPFLTGPC